MADKSLCLTDDVDLVARPGVHTPSGMFTMDGTPYDDETILHQCEAVEGIGVGKVIPFQRPLKQSEALIKAEVYSSIAGFRRLLKQVIDFHDASEEIFPLDEGAAEIILADSDIRIGIRLHRDGGNEHWEVWVKSPNGSIDVSPDVHVRLQFLSLSLSVLPPQTKVNSSMRLDVLAHSYKSREITQTSVQIDAGQAVTINDFGVSDTLALMRSVYGYILRALPLEIAFKQLVG